MFYLHVSKLNVSMKYHLVKTVVGFFKIYKKIENETFFEGKVF